MVEFNNQRAFFDMLRGRRELITDVRNQKRHDVIVGGAIY